MVVHAIVFCCTNIMDAVVYRGPEVVDAIFCRGSEVITRAQQYYTYICTVSLQSTLELKWKDWELKWG